MRENFELLSANIALGHMTASIRAFPLALSDVETEEELQIDDMTSGTAVLNSISHGAASDGRQAFGLAPKTETVKVVRLDEIIAREDLPPPNVMKIDTEGAEAKVLEGGQKTLTKHRPRLAIALHGEDKALATLRILDELGYFTYGFVNEPDSKLGGHLWRRLHAADARILANNNIVASSFESDVSTEILPQEGWRG
jgi:FkbM family methyltransferase